MTVHPVLSIVALTLVLVSVAAPARADELTEIQVAGEAVAVPAELQGEPIDTAGSEDSSPAWVTTRAMGGPDRGVRPYLRRVRARSSGSPAPAVAERIRNGLLGDTRTGNAIQAIQAEACAENPACFGALVVIAACREGECVTRVGHRDEGLDRSVAQGTRRALEERLRELWGDLHGSEGFVDIVVRIDIYMASGDNNTSNNPCPVPGSVPCGTVSGNPGQLECCNPGERCGDGVCH